MEDFILLPTGKPAQRHQLVICDDGSLRRTHNHHNQVYPSQPAQHLFHIQGTEVEEGDWCLWNAQVYKLEGKQEHYPSFKVVASTDPSLNLSPIPEETIQAFIQWYNSKHLFYE